MNNTAAVIASIEANPKVLSEVAEGFWGYCGDEDRPGEAELMFDTHTVLELATDLLNRTTIKLGIGEESIEIGTVRDAMMKSLIVTDKAVEFEGMLYT